MRGLPIVFLIILNSYFRFSRCEFQLQILHNNDMHRRFVESDTFGNPCSEEFVRDGKCFGGFARIIQAVKEAQQFSREKNISSIFLNGGDSIDGDYDAESMAKLVNIMNFNVTTLGNHEFDKGIDSLVKYLSLIKTPVVVCNLNLTSEERLRLPILTPSTVLIVNGTEIGIVGYLTPETMTISSTENLIIEEEIPRIRSEAKRLKDKGVRIIIALGHSGFEMDVKIATEISEISLVIGAHSHSLLHTPKDPPPSTDEVTEIYPYIVTQKSGKKVPVVQAGKYTKYLGILLVTFDKEGHVISASGNTKLLDSSIHKDAYVDEFVSEWYSKVNATDNSIIGYTNVFLHLSHSQFAKGEYESNLANLITDVMYDYGVHAMRNRSIQERPHGLIAIIQSGAIRSQISHENKAGVITHGILKSVLPFSNKLFVVRLTGNTIKKALEHSVEYCFEENSEELRHRFLYFSGMKVIFNCGKRPGNRVEMAKILCYNCSKPVFQPLDKDRVYSVIMSDFVLNGGDKYSMFKTEHLNSEPLNVDLNDVMTKYIQRRQIIYPILDERITVLDVQVSRGSALRIGCLKGVGLLYLFLYFIQIVTLNV